MSGISVLFRKMFLKEYFNMMRVASFIFFGVLCFVLCCERYKSWCICMCEMLMKNLIYLNMDKIHGVGDDVDKFI